jgi:probable rRNA maturation factor
MPLESIIIPILEISSLVKVNFHLADVTYRISLKRRLKEFVPVIFQEEGKEWSQLDIILCSDKYLLQLNKQHLAHDYYTDIITFDLSSKEEKGVGEIYISIDRVKDNADKEDVTIDNELIRVIFHGVLHLCGYQDSTKKLKEDIHKMEDHYLNLFEE